MDEAENLPNTRRIVHDLIPASNNDRICAGTKNYHIEELHPKLTTYISCQIIEKPKNIEFDIWSIIPTFLSSLLVITGWLVVNKTQGNRERRKQIREHATKLKNYLEDLEELVISYHTNERDEAKEHSIISKLSRLEKSCQNTPNLLNGQKFFKAADEKLLRIDPSLIQKLRKSLTLNHFADEHINKLDFNNEAIQEIELAAINLKDSIDALQIYALD